MKGKSKRGHKWEFGLWAVTKILLTTHPPPHQPIYLLNADQAGDKALVIQLIDQGGTVDWSDSGGWTALHQAAIGGHTPVVTGQPPPGHLLAPLTRTAAEVSPGQPRMVKCLLL